MTINQQPDSISFSQNMKPFVLSAAASVTFVLSKGGQTLLSQQYEPTADGSIVVDVSKIVHEHLSYQLRNVGEIYEQTDIVADFVATIDTTPVTFRVLRGGVSALADAAGNFFRQNFLTWQPTEKKVTYYTPEFLTYYAMEASVVKMKAYFSETESQIITLGNLAAGKAYTLPMQCSNIAGKLNNRIPGVYDVWVEDTTGTRLSYVQRYRAESAKSLHEDWVLFENSLGGLDTFRAYGVKGLDAKHDHHIAEQDEVADEYDVDTERLYTKETGYMDKNECAWLLDFFVSHAKYIFADRTLRRIVVTESQVKSDNPLEPAGYNFTYKYADLSPLLNLPRLTQPAEVLHIDIPTLGNFTIPPRLAEVNRQALSEGVLFPVQHPYAEEWGTTTIGSITDAVSQILQASAGNGGGIGHTHANIDVLRALSMMGQYLLAFGKKIHAGYADEAGSIAGADGKYIRKDIADRTDHRLTLGAGANFFQFVTGMIGGSGASFYKDAGGKTVLETDKIFCRETFVTPSITYNTIEIVTGDFARTFSYGVIKSVDEARQVATLDLLKDEVGTPKLEDFNRGLFHNIVGPNETVVSEDANGFLNYCGFATSYFMPVEILVNKPGQFEFRYILQPGTTVHPMAGMKFYAYGNQSDVDRQSITYENRYYCRILSGVNDWVIVPDKHIRFQMGKLDGTNISGTALKGHGIYGDNVYFKGLQVQLTPEQMEQLKPEMTKIYQIVAEPRSIISNNGVLSNPDVYAYVLEKDGKNVTRLTALPAGFSMKYQINMRVSQNYEYESIVNLTHEDAWMLTFILLNGGTVCDKFAVPIIKNGMPGEPGKDGSYYEYRYAKNDSTTTAPYLDNTVRHPSGWTTTQPSLVDGEYMWMTVAVISGDNRLLENWTTPRRFTPSDGVSPYHCLIEPAISTINVLEGGWYDRIPEGKEQLWATRCVLPNDDTILSMGPWSKPFKMESTLTTRFLYSEDADPDTLIIDDDLYDWPGTPAVYPQESEAALVWKSKPSPKTRWIAERENEYGIWRSWWRHEITNEKKVTHSEAWAFTRAKEEPRQPTGGCVESPIPNNNLEPANLKLTAGWECGVEKKTDTAKWKIYWSDDNETWELFQTVDKYVSSYLVPISPAKKYYRFEAYPWGFMDSRFGEARAHLIQDGRKGEQGLAGANHIPIEWEVGKQFLNEESKTGGVRIVHIGLMRDEALSTGWRGYRCKKTHLSSAENMPGTKGGAEYWEEAGVNVAGIITSWICAKNGVMQFFSSNEILINDDAGNICLGLTGGERKDGTKTPIRLWVGAQTPDNAPFRIDQKGEFWATNAHITGDITANTGKIGGFTINGYRLTNKNGEDAYIAIRTQDGSAYREAMLGTGLPATFGAPVNAAFIASGVGDYENVGMYISATGSTTEYMGLLGKKNLAIRATGGVRWTLNRGDHWSMPGVLGVYRFEVDSSFTPKSTHVWGNGVPPLKGPIKWDDRNLLGTVEYNYALEGPVVILAQAYYHAWTADGRRNRAYDVSVIIENETTTGFTFSVWSNNNKHIPCRVDFVLVGVPNVS